MDHLTLTVVTLENGQDKVKEVT